MSKIYSFDLIFKLKLEKENIKRILTIGANKGFKYFLFSEIIKENYQELTIEESVNFLLSLEINNIEEFLYVLYQDTALNLIFLPKEDNRMSLHGFFSYVWEKRFGYLEGPTLTYVDISRYVRSLCSIFGQLPITKLTLEVDD